MALKINRTKGHLLAEREDGLCLTVADMKEFFIQVPDDAECTIWWSTDSWNSSADIKSLDYSEQQNAVDVEA